MELLTKSRQRLKAINSMSQSCLLGSVCSVWLAFHSKFIGEFLRIQNNRFFAKTLLTMFFSTDAQTSYQNHTKKVKPSKT